MAAHHKILCFLLVPGWELHRGGRVGCQVAEKSWKQLQVTHRALSWDWRIAESLETAGKTGELRAFLLLSLQQDPFAPWCLTLQLLQRWLEKLLNRYHSQNTSAFSILCQEHKRLWGRTMTHCGEARNSPSKGMKDKFCPAPELALGSQHWSWQLIHFRSPSLLWETQKLKNTPNPHPVDGQGRQRCC